VVSEPGFRLIRRGAPRCVASGLRWTLHSAHHAGQQPGGVDGHRGDPGSPAPGRPSLCADPAAGDRGQATRHHTSFGQRILRSSPERTAVSPVSAAVPEPGPRAVEGALAPSPSCTGRSWTSPDLLAVRPAPARPPRAAGPAHPCRGRSQQPADYPKPGNRRNSNLAAHFQRHPSQRIHRDLMRDCHGAV
jgi:hypothetical protein